MNKKIKNISTTINIIYALLVVFFILDITQSLEIKEQILKSFVYYSILIMSPVIFIWNIINFKKNIWNFVSFIIPIILVIIIFQKGILGFLISTNSWKAQTILYEDGHFGFKKIEFQMQDIGAFSYNQRIVEVTYFTNWFMITEEFDTTKIQGAPWIKVDKDENELNLIY